MKKLSKKDIGREVEVHWNGASFWGGEILDVMFINEKQPPCLIKVKIEDGSIVSVSPRQVKLKEERGKDGRI